MTSLLASDKEFADCRVERRACDAVRGAGQETGGHWSGDPCVKSSRVLGSMPSTTRMRDAPLEKEPLHVAHVCSLAFVPFSTWRTCLVDAWFLPICCLLARVGCEHRHVPRQAHVAL
eukprot:scaffold64103_cov59-Phaeocystis_antarctica.AAC.1